MRDAAHDATSLVPSYVPERLVMEAIIRASTWNSRPEAKHVRINASQRILLRCAS